MKVSNFIFWLFCILEYILVRKFLKCDFCQDFTLLYRLFIKKKLQHNLSITYLITFPNLLGRAGKKIMFGLQHRLALTIHMILLDCNQIFLLSTYICTNICTICFYFILANYLFTCGLFLDTSNNFSSFFFSQKHWKLLLFD